MIPLIDLRAQHQVLRDEIQAAIGTILDTCDFILGEKVEHFEQTFARFVQARHAIGVSNGLDALRVSLLARDIRPGDEVIVPANTYVATALAVSSIGAKVVLVDAEETTFGLDANQLKRSLTTRTKAVIPVHMYGQSANMDEIVSCARQAGIAVIEDSCQAHGAIYRGRPCGSLGDLGCFSFYPSKNLGACGDGGMVVTNDSALAERVRWLRDNGQRRKNQHMLKGVNARLDAIQAAILTIKLKHLPAWNARRAVIAESYDKGLSETGQVRRPICLSDRNHIYHLYVIRVEQRDALQEVLRARGIQTGIHYPLPIHLQEAYKDLGHAAGDFPVAEQLSRQVLSLPMYPELTEEQIMKVTLGLRHFYQEGTL